MRIGVINGSVRKESNTAGLVSHLFPLITKAFPKVDFELIHLVNSPNLPVPFFIDTTIPVDITSADQYGDPNTRAWSKTVSAWDGVLVISPQYNWGMPGLLKHSFDVLFNEWKGKPVAGITAGGRGGFKCYEQMKEVLGGGFKMRFLDKHVGFNIPDVHKVEATGHEDWITGQDDDVVQLVKELLDMVENPPKA